MLAFLYFELAEFTIDLMLCIFQLSLSSLGSLLTLEHIFIVGCQALKLFHICLNLSLLSGHFTHLDVELFDCLFHLLALL